MHFELLLHYFSLSVLVSHKVDFAELKRELFSCSKEKARCD